jgi:S-adenosylmethionine-dependent methyltransferase
MVRLRSPQVLCPYCGEIKMPDDISDIRKFYDQNVMKEHRRLESHPVERDVTFRYLDAYLLPTGKILDVGAGSGAYTIPLAQRGYSVTATDFSTSLVQECRKQVLDANLNNKVTCLVAEARDLSELPGDFDAVLLMGPLYHLVLEEDRKTAVKEAYGKLKKGGLIFSSFISRYGIWGDLMNKFPAHIEPRYGLQDILTSGQQGMAIKEWGGNFRAYYTTVPEIAPLHEQAGFKTIVLAGVEPAGITADEAYKKLTEEQRKLWLDLLFSISAEPSVVGASGHLLYVGRKG